MKIQLIRNATVRISFGGAVFLVDPWLADKGSLGTFRQLAAMGFRPVVPEQLDVPMPMCALSLPKEDVLAGTDAYIVTHIHPDHVDMAMDGTVGAPLDHGLPLFVQSAEDGAAFTASGFSDVRVMEDGGTAFRGAELIRTPGRHGTETPCGPSCGFILRAPGEPVLYAAGDTVWYEGVEDTLARYQPDVILVNACAARLEGCGRLIMDDKDILAVKKAAPQAQIVAVHMDTVAHACLTRASLRLLLDAEGAADVLMPDDGDTLVFENK